MKQQIVKPVYDEGKEKWRTLRIDNTRRITGIDKSFIWKVTADFSKLDYDDSVHDVYTGFVIAAKDHETVWTIMQDNARLSDCDYDDISWDLEVIGIDLTGEHDYVVQSSYKAG